MPRIYGRRPSASIPTKLSFEEADAKLRGRCATSRKLANNTYLQRRPDGTIAVRLHQTDVVTIHPDNSRTLRTGGWKTVTTKERISEYGLPQGWSLSSARGVWYIYCRKPGESYDAAKTLVFADDMKIKPDGEVIGGGNAEKLIAASKMINDYVKEYMRRFWTGELKRTEISGDPWTFSMTTKEGEMPLGGDNVARRKELFQHMRAKYCFPTLIIRAIEDAAKIPHGNFEELKTLIETGKRKPGSWLCCSMMDLHNFGVWWNGTLSGKVAPPKLSHDQLGKTLRSYLRKIFGLSIR